MKRNNPRPTWRRVVAFSLQGVPQLLPADYFLDDELSSFKCHKNVLTRVPGDLTLKHSFAI